LEQLLYERLIKTVGDQGNGSAKVECDHVVTVLDAQPSEESRVEIEQVQQNVGFASIVDSNPRRL
jgi:predicted RNA-binding protein with TRAM domain